MSKKTQTLRLVDAPLYRYWQALYLAFYSGRLYVDVAKRWRGYGLSYLLLVFALTSIPLSTRIIIDFNRYFNESMVMPLNALPTLYVQNGALSVDKPMPYFVKNPKGEVVAIIDTTGAIKAIPKTYPNVTVFITKNKIIFRPARLQLFLTGSETNKPASEYTQELPKGSNEVFVGKEWLSNSGILSLKWLFDVLVYPIMTLFFYGLSIAALFSIALLGQVVAQILFLVKLTYQQSCRLLLVAITAPGILFFAGLTANVVIPRLGFFYLGLLTIYFCYAVIAVRRDSKQVVKR